MLLFPISFLVFWFCNLCLFASSRSLPLVLYLLSLFSLARGVCVSIIVASTRLCPFRVRSPVCLSTPRHHPRTGETALVFQLEIPVKMNKTSWVQIMVVAESCTTDKDTWTAKEIRERANGNISTKQIRRALNQLEEIGFIKHRKHAKKYEFIEPNFSE